MDDKHSAPKPPAGVPMAPRPPAGVPPTFPTGENVPSPLPEKKTWPKVIATIGAIIGIAAVVITLASMIYTVSSLASCARSLSDPPIGDSVETKAFINDPAVTDRDLETFDILRGEFEDFYLLDQVSPNMNLERQHKAEAVVAVDDYRAQLESGTWPGANAQPDWVSDHRNPQLWVRLAELAQDYIEEQTNETWRIVGFHYPFPNNGPIPVPPTRDEDDCVIVTLSCESGQDKDLVVPVEYYRWASPAYFTCSVDEYRADMQKQKQDVERVLATPVLKGRSCLFDPAGTLYVFSTGKDDTLRDPKQFSQFFRTVLDNTSGEVTSLTLLEEATPLVVTKDSTPSVEGTPAATLASIEEAQNILLNGKGGTLHFATADELLHQYVWSSDGQKKFGEVSGYLIPDRYESLYSWKTIKDGYAADANIARIVAEQYGTSEEQVLAFSKEAEEAKSSFVDKEWNYHIFLPRGIVPETSQEIEDSILELMHTLWRENYAGDESISSPAIYLFVYIVEPDGIAGPGGPATFDKLREEGLADPAQLEDYTLEIAYRIYMSAYGDEKVPAESGWYDDFGMDIEGPLTLQREWLLKQYGLG